MADVLDDDPMFEDEPEDSSSREIPPENRVLRTQAYDKAVGDLVNMVVSEDILLDPDYQRNYVWDNKKASLLVESFLLNVPIPIIYVSEEADGKWSVVDGLQRLASLTRYFRDEFKLSGLEVFQELNGVAFSKLPPKAQRTLKNGILRIIVILQESHPEIKYDIFQRLNRGAIKLNEQELRNCLYRGSLTTALRVWRENPLFLEVFGLKSPHKRFYDAELLLRVLAVAEGFQPREGGVPAYPNKMKSFLNDFMDRNRNLSPEEIDAAYHRLASTMERVKKVFGLPAFRRYIPETGQHDTRLNRALMDAVVATFWHLSDEQVNRVSEALRNLSIELVVNDKAFADALIYGTSDKKKLEYRVRAFYNGAMALF